MTLTTRTMLFTAMATIAAMAVLAAPPLLFGSLPESWILSARYTARFAFVLFLVPFLAPSWIPRFGDGATRDSFLAFAAAHVVHFAALATYLAVSGTERSPLSLAAGGLAYTTLIGLAVAFVRGTARPRFQPQVLHFLLPFFAIGYARRLPAGETFLVGLSGTSACAVALVLRHIKSVRNLFASGNANREIGEPGS